MIYIYSGIPGSGKSTYIKNNHPGVKDICSADNYFIKDGEYKFDPSLLSKAHGFCLRMFINHILLRKEEEDCVVDNTNISTTEIAPYAAIANAYEIPFLIRTIRCDPEVAASRNVHGVPKDKVLDMHKRLMNRQLSKYWSHCWVDLW